MLTFDSQTRPTGTQQNIGGVAIINWSKSIDSRLLGVSGRQGRVTLLPWSTLRHASAVEDVATLSGGNTRVNYGRGISADMPNAGFLGPEAS